MRTWLRSWLRESRNAIPESHRRRYCPSLEGLENRLVPAIAFTQTNLVSDLAGVAAFQDTNLVNAWGLAASPSGPFWVADNGMGVSTVYKGDGTPFPVGSPLVVTIP